MKPKLSAYLMALRPKQWTKNAIVLAAFVFALGDRQQHIGLGALWQVLGAAALFCVVSSGIYMLNDLKDRTCDRAHPTKKHRPIASGRVPPHAAGMLSAVLLILGLGGSALLSTRFLGIVAGYMALQALYTCILKRVALVDLFVIAAGFVLRALGGAVVIGVEISPWLLLCTLLLALFLALCKRRHEKVILAATAGATRDSLSQYDERLLDQLIAIVSAATIVCYAVYTLWPDTVLKFGTHRLGLTIPFVLFGLFRYLDLVYRHDRGDRPEQILLTDLPILVDVALYGASVLLILLLGRL